MKILITGASGFIGQHLVRHCLEQGHDVTGLSRHPPKSLPIETPWVYINLLCNEAGTLSRHLWKHEYDLIFHLAGYNGGIGFNRQYPQAIFRQNTQMALNLFDSCPFETKIISLVTSCGYSSEELENRAREEFYLAGPPHPSVACHGVAKQALVWMSQFRGQEGGRAVTLCPNTVFGPGDRTDGTGKVLGSLIQKIYQAKQENAPFVTLWGTGEPKREFVYVEDIVKVILTAGQAYNDTYQPLNIGPGYETNIWNLAEDIAACLRYEGEIKWDHSKPDGQMRKALDYTRQRNLLFVDPPQLTFHDALYRTCSHYLSTISAPRN